MNPPTLFETERLRLRPVARDDATAIFSTYAGQEEPTRYVDFVRHRERAETEDFTERCVRCWAEGLAFPWAILDKASEDFMGVIELRLSPPDASLGYILGTRFWNHGFATEAAMAVVDWTMRQSPIRRVWATCHPDNLASAHVLEKAGLKRESRCASGHRRPQLGEADGPSLIYATSKGL